MKNRNCRLLAGLLACFFFLSGCRMEPERPAPGESAPQPPEEAQPLAQRGEFSLAYNPNATLNPYDCTDLTNRTLLSLLYESLFRVDAAFAPAPQLARSYTVSGDGRSHVIKVKPGVTFSDGAPLTAVSAANSVRAAMGSAYYGTRLAHLSSVVAYSEDTVTITTDIAYETIAPLLDMPVVKDGTAGKPLPLGTGPYVADLPGEKLVKNPNARQTDLPLAAWDTLTLVRGDSAAAVRDLFEYGTLSLVCADPNANNAAAYHSDFELWSSHTTAMQYLGFNLDSPLFSIAPLRGAVTYALDREELISVGAAGYGAAATLPLSPFSKLYDRRLAESYAYNPAAFAAALSAAEIRDRDGDGKLDLYTEQGLAPLTGTLLVCSDSDQRVASAHAVAEALNALGFSLTVTPMTRQNYLIALQGGKFDLYYGEVRLSPNFDLTAFFQENGPLSYGGIADETLALLCRQTLENSGNTYALCQKIMERAPLCPVLFKTNAVYVRRGLLPALSPYLDCVFCEVPPSP